jgi:hypothetical protein
MTHRWARDKEALPRPFFRRLVTSMRWETDMKPIADLVNYVPHDRALEVHCDRSRFRALAMGRRWGKTTMCAFENVCVGAFGGWGLMVAPTYSMAENLFEETLRMVMMPGFRPLVSSYTTAEGKQTINFHTGGRVLVRSSANPKSLVSRGFDMVTFDEAAKEPSAEVWYASLRPTLGDRLGAALFPSTPQGANWFKEIFDLGTTQTPGYRSWQMASYSSPYLVLEEYEAARLSTPHDLFRQEWDAEFLDSVGTVFKGYQHVATSIWQEAPDPRHRYVLGIDIAQVHDYTVVAVFDLNERRFVWMDRFNQLDYPEQERRFAMISERWNRAPVVIDATNNEAVAQHLSDRITWATVDAYRFTTLSKADSVNELAVAIQCAEVQLLSRETPLGAYALTEFGAYQYQRTASGRVTMSAPLGKHDDVVMACVLAYQGALRLTGAVPLSTPSGVQRAIPTISGRYSSAPRVRRR